MTRKRFFCPIAGIIGNFLEHYDTALFGLLAPFISPLFFEKQEAITGLILIYAMLPLGFLTRPLGSLVFGWIGDNYSRKRALCISLMGTSIVTLSIGCLPLYQTIGLWAPIFLAIARMLQAFFAAGESSGGAIFVLEHTSLSQRGFVSSLYDASSMGGILLASALVTLISVNGYLDFGWRILFWLGGLAAIFGLFLRLNSNDSLEFIKREDKTGYDIFHVFKVIRGPLLTIILASSFSHLTYSLSFTLMNGYVPLVTSLSKADVMHVNTYLLILDLFLLPFFGWLAHLFGKEKIMLMGSFGAGISGVFLFMLLDQASLMTVVAVRTAIIVFGVAFAAPYHAWAMERVSPSYRYLVLSLGSALGSQLVGGASSAVCLWFYRTFQWVGAPGVYLMIFGFITCFIVYRSEKVKPRVGFELKKNQS